MICHQRERLPNSPRLQDSVYNYDPVASSFGVSGVGLMKKSTSGLQVPGCGYKNLEKIMETIMV